MSPYGTPPSFCHTSQVNLAHLQQTCQLDSRVVPDPDTPRSVEPLATSASSATHSPAQQECEFQKTVQPGSPISASLSSARPLLMVAPTGVAAMRGELMLLHKLQAVKEAAKSPAKINKVGSQLQRLQR